MSAVPHAVGDASGAAGLTCRLPITWHLYSGGDGAGFLSFPDLTVIADHSAPINGEFYDRALSKWLPVPRNYVSPDGRLYAYEEATFPASSGRLRVVDVATGRDRVIYDGAPAFSVVDFAAEGIYVESDRGLWLVDPTTGQHRTISTVAAYTTYTVGNGAAWLADFNPADPVPASQVRVGKGGRIYGPFDRIVRVDLGTGASTPWFYQPGADMNVMGADYSGHLFVAVGSRVNQDDIEAIQVWVVASPSAAKPVYSATVNKSSVALAHPWPAKEVAAVDRHGVWFDAPAPPALSSGVWLYSGGSFRRVAEMSDNVSVAGGCIP